MRESLLSILLGFHATLSAAEPPADAYREAIEAGVRAGVYRDVAVGRIHGTERSTFFTGSASAESRFELGAVTEVFTGTLLAQCALEGRLRLQSSLRERLPRLSFADPALGAATLEALATHRVALPTVPPNLLPSDPEDPYAGFGDAELRSLLANYRLGGRAATGYSPLQFGLIGEAIGGNDGGFASLLRDKVLAPLGLKHSDFEDEGLLDAHARGTLAKHWHFGAIAASSGLRSTPGDLLDFLQANLRPENSPIRAALLLARQPRETNDSALGWNITNAGSADQNWPILWRASVTAGFSAFIGFRTDRQHAVVLLGDTDGDLSAIGMAMLDERPPPPAPRVREAEARTAPLTEYTGLYKIGGGGELIIRERHQDLFLQLRGEPAVRLFSDGQDIFDAGLDGVSVSFQREGSSVVNLVLSQAGINVLAHRLTERAPRLARNATALDATVRDQVAGDFQLGPDILLRIAKRGVELDMQITARPAVSLFALSADRFACEDDGCELVVRRDTDRKVTGLEVDFAGGERFAPRVQWSKP